MFRPGTNGFLQTALILISVLILTGCSNSRQDRVDTLRLYSRLWTPLREQTFIREVILPRFKTESGIDVELFLYTDNDLNAFAAAGNLDGVDLVIPYGRDLPLWNDRVDLVNLEEASRSWPERSFIPGIDPWESGGFSDSFLPIGADVYLLIVSKKADAYRPDLSGDAALSWEETVEWVNAASLGEGRGLFAVAGVPLKSLIYVLSGAVLSWGGDFPDLGSDEARSALELFSSMRGSFHKDLSNFESVIEPLVAGEAWFAFAHCAHVGAVLREAPDEYRVYLAPSGSAGMGSVGGVSGLGVLSSGSDPSAAVDLAEFLTRPEVQVSISRGVGGFIPTVSEAMEYLKEDPMDQVIRSGLEVLLGGRIRGIPADIDEWGLAKQIYEGFFHQHLLHADTLDPQVLREAQADLDSLRGPN